MKHLYRTSVSFEGNKEALVLLTIVGVLSTYIEAVYPTGLSDNEAEAIKVNFLKALSNGRHKKFGEGKTFTLIKKDGTASKKVYKIIAKAMESESEFNIMQMQQLAKKTLNHAFKTEGVHVYKNTPKQIVVDSLYFAEYRRVGLVTIDSVNNISKFYNYVVTYSDDCKLNKEEKAFVKKLRNTMVNEIDYLVDNNV